ncbi:39S ribosomal protein L50, mitochondrial [Pectinophora gossypiella]|uniref:Large ribosomal subunit protein mL50 n=1 Tax=Pectinophora gossypiella TaxID=13191 RepID=A0A1E1WIF3_PECGO|nr:39S ribosomal protein L50, mitochondrial [Pectinophora gossypiella]
MFKNLLVPLSRINVQVTAVRFRQKKYPKTDKTLQAASESLAARGFLRPNKEWAPPIDIEETVLKICSANGLKSDSDFDSLDTKFKVLKACFEETGHGVPNSLLHTIECVDDLQEFYSTPVDTTTPFDQLKKMDLPKNLHIQKDYVRFHPDTDTLFNGKSAFPKSSTLVTGLKTRKKYEGYIAKRSWP